MLRIIRSRRYGKTYDLIKYAIKNDCAVICMTNMACQHRIDMAKREFGKTIECYTVHEWQKEHKGRTNQKYVVDELEIMAQWMLGGEMMGWNMSME